MLNFLGLLLMALVLAVPPAGFATIGVLATRNQHPMWRVLSLLPAVPFAVVGANILIDVMRDPTSHNLWPFELIIVGVPATLLLVGFLLVNRMAHRRKPLT